MKGRILLAFATASFAFNSYATTLQDLKKNLAPREYVKPANNDEIFARYCKGNPNTAEIPQPNYDNDLVKIAAGNLANSKVQADLLLQKNAQKEFMANLESLKESLTTLISTTQVPAVKTNAQTILNEISKPGITNISDAAKDSVTEISKEIRKVVLSNLEKLSPVLKAELKGVDFNVMKTVGAQLAVSLQAELVGVDLKKLGAALNKVQTAINSKDLTADTARLVQTSKELVATIGESPTGDIKYMKEILNALITGNAQPADDLEYWVSDIVYYLRNTKGITEQQKAYLTVYDQEYGKIRGTHLIKSAQQLQNALSKPTPVMDEVYDLAQNLIYSLEEAKGLFTASETANIAAYKAEASKFQTQNIIENIKRMNTELAKGTADSNDNAINWADSAVETLKPLMTTLKPATQQAITALAAQTAKAQTQSILTSVQSALEKVQKQFNDDAMYAVQNVGYYFENGNVMKTLSPAAQQLIANTQSAIKEVNAYMQASSVLNSSVIKQESGHFYFYGGPRRMYNLSNTVPSEAKAVGANKEAHWFLTQLCGEFRDRAPMIEAKLKWVQNLIILNPIKDTIVKDAANLAKSANVWKHMTSRAYYPYLQVSHSLWEARRKAMPRYLPAIGKNATIDTPVPGMTVCETKYVFSKYVAAKKSFDGMEAFDAGYATYSKDCPTADLTDYYDFRGDSNFKHYSPEANGMIWYVTSLSSGCKSTTKANGGAFSDKDCENYFTRPFYHRYNAARSGLSTWLFRDDKHAGKFDSSNSMVAIYPHTSPGAAPFAFGFDQTSTSGALYDYNTAWLDIAANGAWANSDIGYNEFTGLGTNNPDMESAYSRIRAAVDRHTDWYSSGYNDGNGGMKDQAYSPFVASSYEMSESDSFTTCGITVQCPPDGLKRWMFIFRIKADNWYTPARIQNNEKIDFDRMWFDETSFGDTGLANSEKAWDRMGTAMETELDSILYLINVDHDEEGASGHNNELVPEPN